MIVTQDPETGYWTKLSGGYELVNTHAPEKCEGRLCDIHDRRGPLPWANWPLNWREDRGIMEVIDPDTGIGHPTRAQYEFWKSATSEETTYYQMIHGCDGACRGLYLD